MIIERVRCIKGESGQDSLTLPPSAVLLCNRSLGQDLCDFSVHHRQMRVHQVVEILIRFIVALDHLRAQRDGLYILRMREWARFRSASSSSSKLLYETSRALTIEAIFLSFSSEEVPRGMQARRTTMAAKQRRGSEPQAGLLPRHREEPRR